MACIVTFQIFDVFCFWAEDRPITRDLVVAFWSLAMGSGESIYVFLSWIGIVVLTVVNVAAMKTSIEAFRRGPHGGWDIRGIFVAMSFVMVFGWAIVKRLDRDWISISERMPTFGSGGVPELRRFTKWKKDVDPPPKARIYPWHRKRNLITIIVEALELQHFGIFQRNKTSWLPFLSNLASTTTFCADHMSPKYTRFCTNSFWAAHCGIPLIGMVDDITKGRRNKNRERLFLRHPYRFPCLGDILKSLGYDNRAYNPGHAQFLFSWGLMPLFHGYPPVRGARHGIRNDGDMVKEVINKTLPRLAKNFHSKGIPFNLIMNFDGPSVWQLGKFTCSPRTEICGRGMVRMALDCIDQHIEELFKRLKQLKLTRENTEIVIYGDHLVSWNWKMSIDPRQIRRVPMIFASREKREITSPTSNYDFAPSVMEALRVRYDPGWPFGRVVWGDDPAYVYDGDWQIDNEISMFYGD
jgi:hypothetical protein